MRREATRRLAGLDHDELAHHPVVLVLQRVAVNMQGRAGSL
jgi:hypothetical protein